VTDTIIPHKYHTMNIEEKKSATEQRTSRKAPERMIFIRSDEPCAPESIPIQRKMQYGGDAAGVSDLNSPFTDFQIEIIALGDDTATDIPVTPVGLRNKEEKSTQRNRQIPTEHYGTFTRPLEYPSFFPGFGEPIIIETEPQERISVQPQQASKKKYYRAMNQKGGKQKLQRWEKVFKRSLLIGHLLLNLPVDEVNHLSIQDLNVLWIGLNLVEKERWKKDSQEW